MAILFADSFDRPDSTSFGVDWLEESARYEILLNQARSDSTFVNWGASGTHAELLVCEAVAVRQDMTVQARFKTEAVGPNFARMGLVARRTAANTYYFVLVIANAGTITLNKFVGGGVATQLTSASFANDPLVYHDYRLEVFGTSLKVFRDNVQLIDFTDSSITAAGKSGIFLCGDAGPDFGFANDFVLADSPGAHLLIDQTVPIDWRTLVELPHIVPVYYSFANMLNINPVIPIAYRLSAVFDEVVPIFWKFPTPLNLDHTIPVQWRRILEVDLTIPIQYGQLDPWTPQTPGESDVWVKQTDSQVDAWAAAGAGEASTWSPV